MEILIHIVPCIIGYTFGFSLAWIILDRFFG
jgi:hypothetical protein